MDGDSDLDAVVAGPENQSIYTPGRVSIFLNQSDGAFSPPISYLTGGLQTSCVRAADVDGDGDLDLITANVYSSSISVLLNNGDGTLSQPIVQDAPGLWPFSMAVGDLDGDSVPDLVARKFYGTEGVFVMFGLGDGTFELGPLYYPSPKIGQLALADFDGDGDDDLAVSSRNEETDPVTFTLMKNSGPGVFGESAQYWSTGTSLAGAMVAIDVDLDGDMDLGVSTDRSFSIFRNDGSGTFDPSVAYGAGWGVISLAAGDVDGDGGVELGTANVADGTFSILWNRGCHSAAPGLPGDLDSDGDVDLLDWVSFYPCILGPIGGPVPDTCSGVSDLDGDGDTDLRDCASFATRFTGP
jgi:hypothetical protein